MGELPLVCFKGRAGPGWQKTCTNDNDNNHPDEDDFDYAQFHYLLEPFKSIFDSIPYRGCEWLRKDYEVGVAADETSGDIPGYRAWWIQIAGLRMFD